MTLSTVPPPVPGLLRLARPGIWVALLLAWFWVQVITVSPELGITADEVIHVTAGHEYWTRGSYRLQPENGNLPQRLAALPLLWLDPRPVPADHDTIVRADTWGVGNLFYFHSDNLPGLMTFFARVMISFTGLGAGVLIYLWGKHLWGIVGGLVATAFFANSPTVLAHAGLATSDMTAAFGFLAAILTGWRLLHRVTLGRILWFGAALGLLCLAKFSAPLIVFIYAGMAAWRFRHRAALPVAGWGRCIRLRSWQRVAPLAGASLAAATLAWGMIWAAYGFRFEANPDRSPSVYPLKWEYLLGHTPFSMQTPLPPEIESAYAVPVERNTVRAVAEWALAHRVLPEPYLFGFLHVYTYSKWRPAFFLGEYSTTGWKSFFPVSVLLKTPLALLSLGLLAILMLLRLPQHTPRAARTWYRLGPLLVFLIIYGTFAVVGNLNIGIRHLLPVECAFAICAGALSVAMLRHGAMMLGVVALLLAANLATWSVRPGYLAFFNRLAGGPDQGHSYFVDSSLDWGQGLPRLADWLAHQPRERTYLAYFGSDSPDYERLPVLRTGDGYFNREPIQIPLRLQPGIYVVSASLLHGVYTMTPGPWDDAYEQAYQRRLTRALRPAEGGFDDQFWFEFDQLRFGRLRHFLLTRRPDAQPDPSLLVYRLSAEELSTALGYQVR